MSAKDRDYKRENKSFYTTNGASADKGDRRARWTRKKSKKGKKK